MKVSHYATNRDENKNFLKVEIKFLTFPWTESSSLPNVSETAFQGFNDLNKFFKKSHFLYIR